MSEQQTRAGGRIVLALWFLSFVNYLERVTMSFAGPAIMKSQGLTPAQFGIVLSSFGVGYVLAQIPGGLLGDRVGARTMLVVGPFFWAVFTGLTGLVATLAGFVAVRVCFGLSEGISNTSIYKAIGENFPPNARARAVGIASTAIAVAPALAGAAVGKLVGAYGWQVMFFVMVVPALCASIVCYILIPGKGSSPERSKEDGERIAFRDVLRRPSLWILSGACFAWNIPYWGFLGWMPSYLALARHIDLKTIGALAGVPYVFAFFGLLGGGWLGGRFERRCALIAVCFFAGAALSLFLAYNALSVAISVAGLSGAAFFLFGASAPIGKLTLDLAPASHRAAYVGVYNTFGQLGGVFAPAVIGFLVSATGAFASGFGFMIAALGLASVLLLVVSTKANTAVAA